MDTALLLVVNCKSDIIIIIYMTLFNYKTYLLHSDT